MACQMFDEAEYLRRAISLGEVPRFYTTSNGQQVSHPFIGQLKDCRTQLTAWFAALGFSPADRARLGLAEIRPNDPLDDLEKRRQARQKAAN
jgi:phage terminase small subunit